MCGLYGVEETTKAVVRRVELKEALPQNEQKMVRCTCKYIIYVCNRNYNVCMCICMNIQYLTLLNLHTITVLPLTTVSEVHCNLNVVSRS